VLFRSKKVRISDYHGKDGLGDLGLPLYGRTPQSGHAVQALIDIVDQYPHEITLVTLGSLTNIALAVRLDPTFAGKIARCVIMGGTGDGVGNVTPVSEANIWMDPEAARIVLESDMPIEMVGWDIAYTGAIFTPADQLETRKIGNPQARFFVDVNRTLMENAMKMNGFTGVDYADPVAMAVALDPSIAYYMDASPIVITEEGLTRGQVVLAKFAHHIPDGSSKIKYVTKIESGSFKKLVFELLESYSP
jgi:purine nucleosidase